MALVVLRHPLVMCTTLLVVMACRRALRACVTRQLWILAPSAPKAAHSRRTILGKPNTSLRAALRGNSEMRAEMRTKLQSAH